MWPFSLEKYMKIRVLTHAETKEIQKMLTERVTLSRDIHALLIERVDAGYENYVRDFKWNFWNPLTFKPVPKEVMKSGLFGKYSRGIKPVQNPKTTQFNDGKEFLFVDVTGYDCTSHFSKTVDLELMTLARIALKNVISNEENRDFANLLMKFAVQPFELTAEDIIKIDDLRYYRDHLKTNLVRIKNELNNSK